MKKTDLIYIPQPRPAATQRLVCFSYAGGNASTYMGWAELLDASLELAVVQLPGRLTRISEPPYQTMAEMTRAIAHSLRVFSDKPLIFFGHSMGARVAYEVCLELQRERRQLPKHFFASASIGPNCERSSPATHHLPDREFVANMMSYKGAPKAALQNKELLALVLPMLRADFKIVETYLSVHQERLPISVSVLVGDQEQFKASDLEAWMELFTGSTGIHVIKGDHFFVDSNSADVTALINQYCRDFLPVETQLSNCLAG